MAEPQPNETPFITILPNQLAVIGSEELERSYKIESCSGELHLSPRDAVDMLGAATVKSGEFTVYIDTKGTRSQPCFTVTDGRVPSAWTCSPPRLQGKLPVPRADLA